MVSVGVSIDLPLFAKHRQDPIIAARAEQANSARLEREATARAVRAQLDADLAEHRAHHARYMRATHTLVPLAEQRAELDRASHAAGRLEPGTALVAAIALANPKIAAPARAAVGGTRHSRHNMNY